jgi:hypothetical protein
VPLCSVTRFIYCNAECHYAQCRYPEYSYAEYRYVKCREPSPLVRVPWEPLKRDPHAQDGST